jgi:hypothetical protein
LLVNSSDRFRDWHFFWIFQCLSIVQLHKKSHQNSHQNSIFKAGVGKTCCLVKTC